MELNIYSPAYFSKLLFKGLVYIRKYIAFSIVLFLIALSFLLTGCITFRNYYDDISLEEVSSIVIYDLRESSSHGSGFYENIDSIYTLEEEQQAAFLEALAEIRFTDSLLLLPVPSDPSFEYGDWVVRINYSDGSYRFISCFGYGEVFDKNGKRIRSNHYGCDDEIWEQLIGQFLPEELFNNG